METKEFYVMKDITTALELDPSNARKYALNKGFKFFKARTVESRNQPTLCLTKEDFEKLVAIRKSEGYVNISSTGGVQKISLNGSGTGVFYVIQLLPDELPNRVKLGYATSLDNRIQAHKTTCPNLKVIFQHTIKEVWEKAIIAMLSCVATKQQSEEIFDVDNIADFLKYTKDILKKFPVI